MSRQKCRCSGGSFWLVHFAGNHSPSICGGRPDMAARPIRARSGRSLGLFGQLWAWLGLLRRHRDGLGPGWNGYQRCGAASVLSGMVIGAVEVVLGAAASFWLGGIKQNSSEAKPLSCEHLVGVRRFELLTSSVSGKRSPPELNARSRVRECAGNNITELPPSGKNYFLKSADLRPYPPRCSANSTRKVAFVPPMNCVFA